jgi:S1-C subfamily serine protease
MKRPFRVLAIGITLAILASLAAPGFTLERQKRQQIISAVVQVAWVVETDTGLSGIGVGSGTIISPDGLILTNCHVADPILYGTPRDQVPDFDWLGIMLTVRSDQPPQPAYLAEVVAADPYLDLAIIRVSRNLDLSEVNRDALDLPYLEIGDSDVLEVGDELNIFGYPGIGGETITFTKGVVSGFTLDASIDGRAWIKTDATIAGGNSGGTGVNGDGLLVGVPTRAGAGAGEDVVDCRPVTDTNGDGRLDERDTCVPIGGFINALRPIQLARPLIESAKRGVGYTQPRPTDEDEPSGPEPELSRPLFSTDVNEYGFPLDVVYSLPSGSRSLYLVFDYSHMRSSMTLEMTVDVDGEEDPDWGLPAGAWRGEEFGSWWIGWSDADLVDATYTLHVLVNGDERLEAEIDVGGPAVDQARFSSIEFGTDLSASGRPKAPGILFPAGSTEIYAAFQYENITPGVEWSTIWYRDGRMLSDDTADWYADEEGTTWVLLEDPRGLDEGIYRLELYLEGRLAATGDFWIAGEGGGEAISFGDVVFASGEDRRGGPLGIGSSFESGLLELHAFIDYDGMEDGLGFEAVWSLDGIPVVEWPYSWDEGVSGTWHDYLYSTSGALPDGEYGLQLFVEGLEVAEGEAVIGAGSQPLPTPTPTLDGVTVSGRILDIDTGRGIAGAIFLVLQPDVTLDTFEWIDDQVYTSAEADRQGYYELPLPLERDECYSMIVGAEDYWTVAEDDVCVSPDEESLLELDVTLERR